MKSVAASPFPQKRPRSLRAIRHGGIYNNVVFFLNDYSSKHAADRQKPHSPPCTGKGSWLGLHTEPLPRHGYRRRMQGWH